jgi:hypothetical protein
VLRLAAPFGFFGALADLERDLMLPFAEGDRELLSLSPDLPEEPLEPDLLAI